MEDKIIIATGLYPVSEVAKRFDVSAQTIKNWIDTEILSGVQLNKLHYVRGESIITLESKFPERVKLQENVNNWKERLELAEIELEEKVNDIKQNILLLEQFKFKSDMDNPLVRLLDSLLDEITDTQRNIRLYALILHGEFTVAGAAKEFQISTTRVLQILRGVHFRIIKYLRKNMTNQKSSLSKLSDLVPKEKTIVLPESVLDEILWDVRNEFSPRLRKLFFLDLQFSNWQYCAAKHNLVTVRNILEYWDKSKLIDHGFGKKSLEELKNWFTAHGIEFTI